MDVELWRKVDESQTIVVVFDILSLEVLHERTQATA